MGGGERGGGGLVSVFIVKTSAEKKNDVDRFSLFAGSSPGKNNHFSCTEDRLNHQL